MDPELAMACDRGEAESIQADWMSDLVTYLENVLPVEK